MWGNTTFAPDDLPNVTHSHGALIAFRQNSPALEGNSDLYNMTSNDAGTWILERVPETFQVRRVYLPSGYLSMVRSIHEILTHGYAPCIVRLIRKCWKATTRSGSSGTSRSSRRTTSTSASGRTRSKSSAWNCAPCTREFH